jgi:hypothetical protein
MNKPGIEKQIMKCTTFGDLLEVLKSNYDTNFTIPFLLKIGMANQLPNLLKPFKKNDK